MNANRVLLIFNKDAAHLWPQITVFLVTLALFVCTDPTYVQPPASYLSGLIELLLPISCWLLVTSLVQQERAIGDKQYWLTRPFSLRHLLAAKALFLVVFAILPVFVGQAIVLSVVEHSSGLQLGNLAVKQIFYVAWFLLPMGAIASVTKSLGEAFITALLVLLVPIVIIWMLDQGWNGLSWIPAALAALVALCGSAGVVYVQYNHRRAALGRWALAVAAIAVGLTLTLPPAAWAFALQSSLSQERVDPRDVRISFDSTTMPPHLYAASSPEYIRCSIPVRIDDVPPCKDVFADWLELESPWRSGWSGRVDIVKDREGKRSLRIDVRGQTWERWKDTPVQVRGLLGLTLVVPSAGQCGASKQDVAYCLWNPLVFEPFPISPWFGPLDTYNAVKNPLVHPAAHIQRPFDLGPLKLSDYVTDAR